MCTYVIKCSHYILSGVMMSIRGEEQVVRGGVLFALADTLAAHSISGFKVGVGFALRKCRMYKTKYLLRSVCLNQDVHLITTIMHVHACI